MNTPPKIKLKAFKSDGTETTLEVEAADILSAAISIVGPGKAIELMDKDGKPIFRIYVSTAIEHGAPAPAGGSQQ